MHNLFNKVSVAYHPVFTEPGFDHAYHISCSTSLYWIIINRSSLIKWSGLHHRCTACRCLLKCSTPKTFPRRVLVLSSLCYYTLSNHNKDSWVCTAGKQHQLYCLSPFF